MNLEKSEIEIREEELMKIQGELMEQLELVGESLRVLSHQLLEVNRHANDAYQRHAAWLVAFNARQRGEVDDDSSDGSGYIRLEPV